MMRMRFVLCIWTLCQTISFTASSEVNGESKSSEDNYALRYTMSTKTNTSSEEAHEADENSKIKENNLVAPMPSTEKSPIIKKEDKEYDIEKIHGDMADLFGTNQHHSYPEYYKDLGRRFVLQYPYKEVSVNMSGHLRVRNINLDEEAETNLDNIAKDYMNQKQDEEHLIPVKASPELVLAVAAKSALLEAALPHKPLEEKVDKEILRSGDYWNDVWREDVDPNILRTQNGISVGSVKVKVMPGSKLYKLVSELKKISPRLLYVINNE